MALIARGRDTYPSGDEVYPSAARTATPAAVTFNCTGASGLVVVIDVTAFSATPSVVFTIKGIHYPSGPTSTPIKWTLLTSAAITGTGTTALTVHPAITNAANVAASALVPQAVEILPTHGDSDSITYSVTAILTP